MKDVLGPCDPFKIAYRIVGLDAVPVIDFAPLVWVGDKGRGNQSVNLERA
jgi:hypothetical protein